MNPSLPPINVTPRQTRLVAAMHAKELDALIVTAPANIRWLTGFAGSSATVLVVEDEITLFTDARYADRAPDELRGVASTADVIIARESLGHEVREIAGSCENVGLEADHVTWSQHTLIADTWLPEQMLIPTGALIEQLRSRKDDAEVARIESAAAIVDEALAEVVDALVDRPTEREFARTLDAAIRAGGAEDLGFDTIVASGPNGAIPHHQPGDRVIESGDLVIVDVGGKVDGYRSDMTRTFCIGGLTTEQRLHYETVIAAQQAGVDAMIIASGTVEVDAAARAVIADAGWADSFTHGTGHGIGLDIHELPRVAKGVKDVYENGTVATVEPGVYLRGVAGVRIEDTCLATPDGARRLTGFLNNPNLVNRPGRTGTIRH